MWKPGTQKPLANGDIKSIKSSSKKINSNASNKGTKSATLSQKTLAMKFMQRKSVVDQTKVEKDDWKIDEDTNKYESNGAIICERDVADPSLPTIFGRRSFGGFNKNIEEEYREASRQLKYSVSNEKALQEEVSAEEMTKRMIKYTGLLRGKGRYMNYKGNHGNYGNHPSEKGKKRQRE